VPSALLLLIARRTARPVADHAFMQLVLGSFVLVRVEKGKAGHFKCARKYWNIDCLENNLW
jgi:hypothetical protein